MVVLGISLSFLWSLIHSWANYGLGLHCVLGTLSKARPALSLKSSDGGRKRSLNMMESVYGAQDEGYQTQSREKRKSFLEEAMPELSSEGWLGSGQVGKVVHQ